MISCPFSFARTVLLPHRSHIIARSSRLSDRLVALISRRHGRRKHKTPRISYTNQSIMIMTVEEWTAPHGTVFNISDDVAPVFTLESGEVCDMDGYTSSARAHHWSQIKSNNPNKVNRRQKPATNYEKNVLFPKKEAIKRRKQADAAAQRKREEEEARRQRAAEAREEGHSTRRCASWKQR